jgi:hypothetical protein
LRRQEKRIIKVPPSLQSPETRTEFEDIPVAKYEFTSVCLVGGPEDFYTSSTGTLPKMIGRVLEAEGPIHISELSRRVAAHWGMQRAGNKIVKRVRVVANAMCGKKSAKQDGDFYDTYQRTQCPVRNRDIEGVIFDTEIIPHTEVKEAIRLLLRHRAPLMREEIVRETGRLLGFARIGKKLRELIETELRDLEVSGDLRVGGTGIHLAPE